MKDCLGREIKVGDFVAYAKQLRGASNPTMAYGRVVSLGIRKYMGNEEPVLNVRTPRPSIDDSWMESWKSEREVQWGKENQLLLLETPPTEIAMIFEIEDTLN